MARSETVTYSILDPTGNITALVESAVEPGGQPALAAGLMRRHPEVEQVGFLRPAAPGDEKVACELRMAGGEFCGNASMCAAALCFPEGEEGERTLSLRVSGAREAVLLRLRRTGEDSFDAAVRMPPALGVQMRAFSFEGLSGELTLVRMEGISHLIVTPDSVFFALREDKAAAERAVRELCETLAAEGLGLLFLEGGAPVCRMTPLVYVPGSATVFWENACASGSAAAGMYLAAKQGGKLSLTLHQPGGSLRAECGPMGETWLYGSVKLLGRYRIEI